MSPTLTVRRRPHRGGRGLAARATRNDGGDRPDAATAPTSSDEHPDEKEVKQLVSQRLWEPAAMMAAVTGRVGVILELAKTARKDSMDGPVRALVALLDTGWFGEAKRLIEEHGLRPLQQALPSGEERIRREWHRLAAPTRCDLCQVTFPDRGLVRELEQLPAWQRKEAERRIGEQATMCPKAMELTQFQLRMIAALGYDPVRRQRLGPRAYFESLRAIAGESSTLQAMVDAVASVEERRSSMSPQEQYEAWRRRVFDPIRSHERRLLCGNCSADMQRFLEQWPEGRAEPLASLD